MLPQSQESFKLRARRWRRTIRWLCAAAIGVLVVGPCLADPIAEQRRHEEQEAIERATRPEDLAEQPAPATQQQLRQIENEARTRFAREAQDRLSAGRKRDACAASYRPSQGAIAAGAVRPESAAWNSMASECRRIGPERFVATFSQALEPDDVGGAETRPGGSSASQAAADPQGPQQNALDRDAPPQGRQVDPASQSAAGTGSPPPAEPGVVPDTGEASESGTDKARPEDASGAATARPAHVWAGADLSPEEGNGSRQVESSPTGARSALDAPPAHVWTRSDVDTSGTGDSGDDQSADSGGATAADATARGGAAAGDDSGSKDQVAETLADKKPDSKNANASGPEAAVVVEPAEDDPAKDAENQEEADPAPAHLWERHQVADSGPGGGGDAEEELALGNVPVEIIGEIPEELRNIEVQVESEPLDIEPVTVSFVGVLPGELIPEDGDSVPSTPGLLAGIPENADDVSVVDLSQISQDTPGDGLVTDVGGVVLETSAQDDDSGGLFQQLFGSIGSLFDPVTEYFGLGATGPSDPLVDDGIAGGNPGGATGPSSGVAPMEPTEQLTGDPDTAPVSQTSELDANQDAQTAESAAQSPDKVGLDQVAESTLPTADAGGAGATPDLPPDRVPPTPAVPQSLGGLLAQERALAGDIEAASSTIEAIQSGALDIDAMSAEQRTALLGSLERIAPLMDAIDPARLQAREQELAAISDDMRQTDDMIRKFGEDASRDGTIANIWAAIYTVGNAVGGTLAAVELSNIPVVSQQAKLLSATMGLSEGAVGVAGTLGPIASAGVRSNAQSGPGLGVPTGRPGASGSGPGNTTGHPLPEAANRQVDRFNKTLELIGSADTFDDAMKHVYGFENQWKAELTQLENLKTAVDTGRSLSSFRSSTQGALDATNDGETSVAVQKGLLASAAAMKFADATVETSRWAAELGGSERFAQQFSGLGNRMGWAGSGAELAERAGNVIEGANMFLDGRAEQVRLDQVNASMHRQSGQAINRVAELQQVSRRLQQYHGKFTNPDTRQLIERLRNSP